MSEPDVIYECHNDRDSSYRLSPNPDAEPGTGFKYGAVLQYKEKSDKSAVWSDQFFIAPDALGPLGKALLAAGKDVT